MPPASSDLVRLAKIDVTLTEDARYTYVAQTYYGWQHHAQKTFVWRRTYKRINEVGSGAVYLEERDLDTDSDGPIRRKREVRAVKCIRKLTSKESTGIDYGRELQAIAQFSQRPYQQYFVRSDGWYETEKCIYITMEYMKRGNLHEYVRSGLPEDQVQTIIYQVLKGLSYMHGLGYTHRDLKPENLLVKQRAPAWQIKIADFGLSKRIVEHNSSLRTQAGTPGFQAPEILGLYDDDDDASDDDITGHSYTNAVDMWAVGAIAFLIAAGELPFPTYNQRSLGRYARGKSSLPMHVLQKADVSSTGRELIQSLLARQPSQRPSAVDCLHHEWLDGSRAADSRSETTVETIVPSLSAPSSASASWDTPEDKMQTIGPNRLSAHPPPVESAEDQSAERQHLSVLLRPTSVDDGLTLNHSSFVETQRFDLLPPMPEPYLDHGVVGAVPSQLEPQINQTVHSIPEDGGPITNTTNKFKDGKKHHGRIKDQRSLLIEDFEATKLESRGGRRRYEPSVRVKVVPIEQGNPSGKAVMQIVRRDKDGKLSTTRKILLGTDRKNAETEHAPHEGAKSLQSSKSNVFGEMDVSLTPPHKLLKDDISVDVHEESQITGKKPSSPPDRFNSLQAKSTSTHLQPGHDRGPRKPQALIRRGHEMKPDSHERKIRPSSLDDQGDDDTVSIVESVLPYSGIQPLRSGDHLAETSQAQKVNNLHLLSGRLTEPIPVLSSRPSANFDALQREAQTVVVANARSNTSQVQDPRFQDIMTPTETQFLPVFSATPWHRTFEHKKMPQNSPIFSPDGRMFAAACDSQRRLYVLDMSSTGESTYIDTESCTNTIAFSLDSWYLLSLSTGGLYQRWNLASRLEEGRTRLCLPKNRHIDSAILLPDNLALTSSPDFTNRRVLSEVQLWDVKSATLIWTLEYRDSIQGLCVSSERRVLVAKGGEENCVWHLEADIRQGTKYGQHPRKCTSYPGKQSLAISRDGQLLAQSRWGSIPIWNIKDWEQVRDLQTGGSALAFSPVADILAELSSQHIRLWDVATGRIVRTIEVPRSFEQCTLNFSPDGTVLAYSDSNHTTLYCWKIAIACTPDCKGNSEKKIPHTYL